MEQVVTIGSLRFDALKCHRAPANDITPLLLQPLQGIRKALVLGLDQAR